MRLRSMVSLLLCLSLIFLSYGFANIAYANPDSDESETNVITASDAGGGDISGKELAAIIFITLMVTIIIIVALVT